MEFDLLPGISYLIIKVFDRIVLLIQQTFLSHKSGIFYWYCKFCRQKSQKHHSFWPNHVHIYCLVYLEIYKSRNHFIHSTKSLVNVLRNAVSYRLTMFEKSHRNMLSGNIHVTITEKKNQEIIKLEKRKLLIGWSPTVIGFVCWELQTKGYLSSSGLLNMRPDGINFTHWNKIPNKTKPIFLDFYFSSIIPHNWIWIYVWKCTLNF